MPSLLEMYALQFWEISWSYFFDVFLLTIFPVLTLFGIPVTWILDLLN